MEQGEQGTIDLQEKEKQYAMDTKIKERYKTCEKQCMQEDLDRSRSVEKLSSRSLWIE